MDSERTVYKVAETGAELPENIGLVLKLLQNCPVTDKEGRKIEPEDLNLYSWKQSPPNPNESFWQHFSPRLPFNIIVVGKSEPGVDITSASGNKLRVLIFSDESVLVTTEQIKNVFEGVGQIAHKMVSYDVLLGLGQSNYFKEGPFVKKPEDTKYKIAVGIATPLHPVPIIREDLSYETNVNYRGDVRELTCDTLVFFTDDMRVEVPHTGEYASERLPDNLNHFWI